MPKAVDKELMKEKIMKATVSAFLKYGVKNTTMDAIAKKANLAKGTLYIYFESKSCLLSSITDIYFSDLKKSLISDEPITTLDELLAHIKNNLLTGKKSAKFMKIFFDAFGEQLSHENFTDKYDAFFEEIAHFYNQSLKRLMRNGEINKNIDLSAAGRTIVSMMDGLILHRGFFNIADLKYAAMANNFITMLKALLIKG